VVFHAALVEAGTKHQICRVQICIGFGERQVRPTASIVWLPDGSVMLGVRNHLDAPIITILSGDTLTTLPDHAAELPHL